MGNLLQRIFGSHRGRDEADESSVTKHDQAVLDIKVTRDKMKQYAKKIQQIAEREQEAAKQLMQQGKRDQAKLALRKRRYQLSLLDKCEKQLDNIQQMISEIEFAQVEVKFIEGLKQGTQTLKALQQEMKLEDVERLMDESREAVEYQEEISRQLSEALSPEDLEAADDELANLEAAMVKKDLDAKVQVPKSKLPEVAPATTTKTKTTAAAASAEEKSIDDLLAEAEEGLQDVEDEEDANENEEEEEREERHKERVAVLA